jgi:hypothetical protein
MILLSATVFLTACASDAERLEKLQFDEAFAAAQHARLERERDSVAIVLFDSMVAAGKIEPRATADEKLRLAYTYDVWGGMLHPRLQAAFDSVAAAKDRLLLAQREMNAFTQGR